MIAIYLSLFFNVTTATTTILDLLDVNNVSNKN